MCLESALLARQARSLIPAVEASNMSETECNVAAARDSRLDDIILGLAG